MADKPTFKPKQGDKLIRAGLPTLDVVYVDDLVQAGALYKVVGR